MITAFPATGTAPQGPVPRTRKTAGRKAKIRHTDASSQPVLIHLLTQDIIVLRSKGVLPKLPYITLEEINDKSKSDNLVRTITVIQIT